MYQTVFFLLVVAVCSCSAADVWMEEPYGSNSFNTRAKFNTNVTLHCNDTEMGREAPSGAVFSYWIAPNLGIVREGAYIELPWTIDGTPGWSVSQDGLQLTAFLLQEDHFGFYHCVMQDPNDDDNTFIIKRGINYEGPYWGDLWKKYEEQTIIGLSSAGGFLVMVVLIGITMHFRYDNEDEKIDIYKSAGTSNDVLVNNHAFDNGAFETPVQFQPPTGVNFQPVAATDVKNVYQNNN